MTGDVAVAMPIEAVGEGDARVLALFDVHHQRLYALARRLSPNAEDARDLVQETFLKVAAAVARVPPGRRDEEAWLVRVLVNLSRDRWRRTVTWRRYFVREARRHREGTGPESALVARTVIRQALQRLPPRRRAIIVLHELEGHSPPEIGRLLGIKAVTVRWHLSRGRHELARILQGVSS